jgi:putative hemolysin
MTGLADGIDHDGAESAAAAFDAPRRRWRPTAGSVGLPSLFPKISALGGLSLHRPLPEWPETLGRLGPLEIRLARSSADVRRAQGLRYQVFYEEMSAVPDLVTLMTRRDIDEFDAICDHLLVFDRDAGAKRSSKVVVGTYRLLRQDVAERHGGFYSSAEYRLSELIERQFPRSFLELGRSCVLRPYRSRRTIELLWYGIYTYVVRHHIDVLVGCASFAGTDPDKLALPLSYLHHHASAPEPWQIRAHPDRYVEMNRLPKTAIDAAAAFRNLPPLIRGYLRVGAYVGCGAVIDRRFATTDVLIILPVSAVRTRYLRHFGRTAERQPR